MASDTTKRSRGKTQNVHTISCLHREPGITLCCCWLDLEAGPEGQEDQHG